jgi:hypothetical protein
MPVLRVDAHATVVEAALKGYMKARSSRSQVDEEVRKNAGPVPKAGTDSFHD